MQKEKRWGEARGLRVRDGHARSDGVRETVIFSFMILSRRDERFLVELITLIRSTAPVYVAYPHAAERL